MVVLQLLRSAVDDQFCEGHRPEIIHDFAFSESAVKRTPGLAVGRAHVALAVSETLILAVTAAVRRMERFGAEWV